jgi:hypothetical protein
LFFPTFRQQIRKFSRKSLLNWARGSRHFEYFWTCAHWTIYMSLNVLAARYTVKTWSWIRVLLFTLGKPPGQNFLTIPHPRD